MASSILFHAVLFGLALPSALLLVLGMATLFNRPLTERHTGLLLPAVMGGSFLAFLVALGARFFGEPGPQIIHAGTLFAAGAFDFSFVFLADHLSLLFALLTVGISGVVAAFGSRYLHRERGFHRFYCLLTVLVVGMLLIVLAANVEVLFAGWEFLGISSALLVAFFLDRPLPTGNALRIFIIYRIGDAALLASAVCLMHYSGGERMESIFLHASGASSLLTSSQATKVGLLLVLAVAAKCAQLPFSTWLPRAMEGPTPSSAVFYGALSIHAGAYLLIRLDPILAGSPVIQVLIISMGLGTALYSTLVGRTQTDIKSALAFASLTQVSIILVEIALGLETLAVIHITGHACLRLLQFLRSPSLLHDVHSTTDSLGESPAAPGEHIKRHVPTKAQLALYRFAIERGSLDDWLDRLLVFPFQRLFRGLDRLDQSWCAFLSGSAEARSSKKGQKPSERSEVQDD